MAEVASGFVGTQKTQTRIVNREVVVVVTGKEIMTKS